MGVNSLPKTVTRQRLMWLMFHNIIMGMGAEYCDDRVYWCVSVHEHISGTTHPIFIFMHVTRGRGSIFLWQGCDMLCTSGLMDDVMFTHKGPYGGLSMLLQLVTSLCLRAQTKTPAASY